MKTLAKLAITAVLFVLIFRAVDARRVLEALAASDMRLVVPAAAAQFAALLVASYRWFLAMQVLAYPQPYGFFFRSYLKGHLFNQGLPTSIGGDALRMLDVMQQGYPRRQALFSVLVDRVMGVSGLLVLSLAANLSQPALLPRGLFWLVNLVAVAGLAAIVVALLLRHVRPLQGNRWLSLLPGLSEELSRLFRVRRAVGLQFVLSVATQLLVALVFFCLGQAVAVEQPLSSYLVIVPMVLLLSLVPISLAGWGLREGALVGLFALLGADTAAVLTMSILYGVLLVVVSLPGLHFYLAGNRPRPATDAMKDA